MIIGMLVYAQFLIHVLTRENSFPTLPPASPIHPKNDTDFPIKTNWNFILLFFSRYTPFTPSLSLLSRAKDYTLSFPVLLLSCICPICMSLLSLRENLIVVWRMWSTGYMLWRTCGSPTFLHPGTELTLSGLHGKCFTQWATSLAPYWVLIIMVKLWLLLILKRRVCFVMLNYQVSWNKNPYVKCPFEIGSLLFLKSK